MSAKRHETLNSKLDARLASNMVSIYMQGYDEDEHRQGGHDGMELLQKLRKVKLQIDTIGPLVKALGDTCAPAQDILKAVQGKGLWISHMKSQRSLSAGTSSRPSPSGIGRHWC